MRTKTDGDNASGVPTLSELISERKSLRGFSYADLENRAGSVITRQRWQQLGSGVRIKEFPEPATLEAMAAALDTDVAEVILAAARSIGLDVKRGARSDLAARLPSSADRLSVEQRDAIVTLVRSITETSHDTDTQPASDADRPPASGTPRETREGEKTIGRIVRVVRTSDNDDTSIKRDGSNEQQSSPEAGDIVHMVPPPAGTAPDTLAASAHWPDGVDVDASDTADEYQAWLDDGSPDTWRVYRERRNAGLRPAALDYGPDDEGESERAAREQDEAAEGSQDGEE